MFILTSYVQGQLFKCPQPRISFFCSRVAVFTSDPSCVKYWLLHPFSTRKPCAKAVLETDYFMQRKQYHKRTILRTWPWQPRKWSWVISPDYCASHPRCFCAVGYVVAQRYDVLCDWLWDASHMAGVRWRSRCKGFCSQEGPHYPFKWSARKLS